MTFNGPGVGTLDEYVPDNLIAGDFPLVTYDVTVAEGQNLKRGAVVGRIHYEDEPTGEVKLSLAAATDGSEDPYAILVADVDATDEAKPGSVYVTGMFSEGALTIGAGHTAASVREALLSRIYIKNTVAAPS